MSQSLDYILMPSEIDTYVKHFKLSSINSLGSKVWFEMYQCLQKLHQQAVLEAQNKKEETVKEAFIVMQKVPVLVYEAICVSVWREKVLPGMLELEPNPSTMLIPYVILLHEATVVAMLDTILFHEDGCEALENTSLELVEYCAFACAVLLSGPPTAPGGARDPSSLEQFACQRADLRFQTGLRCVTVLSYLAQNLRSLPLNATSLVFSVHDIPLLFANLIMCSPWLKTDSAGRTFKYEDGKWQQMAHTAGHKVTGHEGQVWIALRQLLLDPDTSAHYEINESRRNQLVKLQGHLTETLLDQLPPLVDLKGWLARLSLTGQLPHARRPLILEVSPQFRTSLLSRSKKQWKLMVQEHTSRMLNCSPEHIKAISLRLNDVYNLDVLEALEKPPSCEICGGTGTKRCSRCHVALYCSRECQVKNWKYHKPTCDLLVETAQK
ncbi:zinc finger MYND domain-containing protein 10 [Bacillus rossius redtenbacheri]|uniref:zinc finger MYND domain-containing protein 10 n=1 Tax=Bacillus rossius redtenbacheri TaxID=93214 RepID=UPI002FDC939C